MSKRKGMSMAEKREKLLEMYHTSKKVYTMVEVEKEGPKTGVVRSAVMDVNQQLVDDGQVEMEKIGSVNYCWSFPSKQAQRTAEHLSQLEAQVHAEQAAIAGLKRAIETARALRPESDARTAQLAQLKSLAAEARGLEASLEALKENDPVEIARKAAEVEMCRVAANRWDRTARGRAGHMGSGHRGCGLRCARPLAASHRERRTKFTWNA